MLLYGKFIFVFAVGCATAATLLRTVPYNNQVARLCPVSLTITHSIYYEVEIMEATLTF